MSIQEHFDNEFKINGSFVYLQVLGQTAKTILANHFAYSAKEWKI